MNCEDIKSIFSELAIFMLLIVCVCLGFLTAAFFGKHFHSDYKLATFTVKMAFKSQ